MSACVGERRDVAGRPSPTHAAFARPEGGGFNSTLSAGTVVLATPLANGQSINIHFLLGIQATGRYKFYLNVEVLP